MGAQGQGQHAARAARPATSVLRENTITTDRSIKFQEYGKTPRWNREVIVTEKIDGTHADIGIRPVDSLDRILHEGEDGPVRFFDDDARVILAVHNGMVIYAQSRNRLLTPEFDNFGFAAWVQQNAAALIEVLGTGLHAGEWYGRKLGRGYGLTERRFALFDQRKTPALTAMYDGHLPVVEGLETVPVLYRGTLDHFDAQRECDDLRKFGSIAVPGFMDAEGIVIWHSQARQVFKVLLDQDHLPKTLIAAT